jgi:hypothetical protein
MTPRCGRALTARIYRRDATPTQAVRVPFVLRITAGGLDFEARLEEEKAPRTIAALRPLLPLDGRLVQARWSGEAAWVPLGLELELGLNSENATTYPAPGELLLYPGGLSEVEILFPYGATNFASKMGQLAGNHFATIESGRERLAELGNAVLWEGAQAIRFEET